MAKSPKHCHTHFEELVALLKELDDSECTGKLVLDFKKGDWRWHIPVANFQYNPTVWDVKALLALRED